MTKRKEPVTDPPGEVLVSFGDMPAWAPPAFRVVNPPTLVPSGAGSVWLEGEKPQDAPTAPSGSVAVRGGTGEAPSREKRPQGPYVSNPARAVTLAVAAMGGTAPVRGRR